MFSIVLGAATLLSACADPDTTTDMTTSTLTTAPLTRSDWDALRAHTVFFGHQSVGENIIDGLRQIGTREGWPELPLVEGVRPAGSGPAMLHSKIGQNGDPSSKIAGFAQALDAGAGQVADVALMKFCFWDIRADTNVDAVFDEYQRKMRDVAQRFPQLTLLHATVPLVVEDQDWRARVRRLLGKPVPTDVDNARREALNHKLRAAYGNHVFDIARAEQDGEAASAVPHLSASFSSDGAHLNDAGRRQLASAFVRTVAAASRVGAPR
jgi:hypothetical protein